MTKDPEAELTRLMEVIVVGDPRRLRNPRLTHQIPDFLNIKYAPPIFLEHFTQELIHTNRLNKLLLSRELSLGELGCAAAHRLARSKITSRWALILEDDAQIQHFDSVEVLNALKNADDSCPSVINLFGNHLKNSSKNLTELRYMPSGTVGYIASRNLQEIDVESPGAADWPLSFVECKFYFTGAASVIEVDSKSLIGSSDSRKNLPLKFYSNAIAKTPEILFRFGVGGLKFGFLMPLIRDLSKKKRSREESRAKKNI